MKNTIYLIAGFILLTIASCGGNNSYPGQKFSVYLDNGLDTTVIVTITEKGKDSAMVFNVIGYDLKEIELANNTYHITAKTVADSLIIDEDFTIDKNEYHFSYNLNLTKQDYIVENVVYIVSENPDSYKSHSSFTYKGKTYDEIDARVIEGALLVPNDWDYNINDEMPDEIEISNGSMATKSQVYRAEMFVLILDLYELFGGSDMDMEAF